MVFKKNQTRTEFQRHTWMQIAISCRLSRTPIVIKCHNVLFCSDRGHLWNWRLLKLPSMGQVHLQPACIRLRPNPEKAENENAFLGCCKQVYFALMIYTSYCVTTDRFFWVKLLALRRTGMVWLNANKWKCFQVITGLENFSLVIRCAQNAVVEQILDKLS